MRNSHLGGQNHEKTQISEGKIENFEEKKVQHAITGAFLSPDTKCYTILKLSCQADSGNLGPTAHSA